MPAAPDAVRPLVLASASRARRIMLENAGLRFSVVVPDVDETKLRNAFETPESNPAGTAALLADAKGRAVSRSMPNALIIAADQVLEVDGRILVKATDLDEARAVLAQLRGRQHTLISAVTLIANDVEAWRYVGRAIMTMRPFSDAFLNEYLARAGEPLYRSVGAYAIEGLGAQLFEKIEGDYFTILGLPLIPLLDRLRAEGMLAV